MTPCITRCICTDDGHCQDRQIPLGHPGLQDPGDAADACNGNKVRLNGATAKAAKAVKPGDTLEIRRGSALLSYRVLKAQQKAAWGAALVPEFAENLTPQEELDKLRPRGRP